MKRWGQNLILIFISSAVAIGLAELSIRLLVPKERWQFRDSSVDWQPDSLLGWRQKINYKATNYDLGPVPIVFETNADGFRPKTAVPASVSDSSLVVFLVGNSTVNGRHVSERETIHYWLDSLLTSRGKKPVVVNASVQGYSTDQALLMIRRYARQYKPDWIIYGFCDNDLGGIVSQQAYGLNKPMFARQGDSTKLIPMTRYNEDFAA